MAVLAVATPTLAGVLLNAVAAAGGGDSFPNDGYTLFYAKNGSGAPITITFDGVLVGPDNAVAFDSNVAVSLAAGAERVYGPFVDKARWNDANGRVNVTYSGVTSLTVAPIRAY